MRISRSNLKVALVTASFATCLALSSSLTLQAGSLGGAVGGAVGGLGGAVGGAVGGVGNAVGGAVGGAVGAVGGAVGGATGAVGGALGGDTTSAGSSTSSTADTLDTVDSKKKGLKAKAKIKLKLGQKKTVKTNFIAGTLTKKNLGGVKAKVQVGSLVKAKVGAKVLSSDGTLVGAKAKLALGGSSGVKAGVGAKVGTDGVAVGLGVSIGGSSTGTNGTGGPATTPKERKEIASQITSMSDRERVKLKKKCSAVMGSPASYSREAVQVCRVLAELLAS